MPPALIVAGIGAAASIGGAALSSSAQKKAAKSAATTAQNTTNANNALTQGIYNQNSANIRPFIDSGLHAQGVLNGLLYGPQQSGAPMSTSALGYMPQGAGGAPGGYTMAEGGYGGDYGGSALQQGQPQAFSGMPQVTSPEAQNAWQQFFDSSGARSVLNEGQRAVNVNYAAHGVLQSGAAQKALQDRGQQQLLNNYLMPYMGMLQGQQGVGLSGANALAGVGTNMVNSVTANNNSASSAAANAALMGGQANANMYGGIAGALGNFAGSLGSSFGKSGGSNSMYLPPTTLPYGGTAGGGWF